MSRKLFFGAVFLLVGDSLREVTSVRLSVSSLDENKKAIIGQFRSMVDKDLPHDYMKADSYLLRFLSARDFNLKEASAYLKENLAWRKLEKIDSILDEDWSDMEKRFPYQLSTSTKDGRPVLYKNFGEYDVRALVAEGVDVQRYVRYNTAKMMEDADRKVRAMRKGDADDVAQFDIIMSGYSKEKHGCPQCIQLCREVMQMSEARYSGAVDNLFIINTPPDFQEVYPYLAASLQEDKSRESIHVFEGRETWEPVLLNVIAKEELPKELQ